MFEAPPTSCPFPLRDFPQPLPPSAPSPQERDNRKRVFGKKKENSFWGRTGEMQKFKDCKKMKNEK